MKILLIIILSYILPIILGFPLYLFNWRKEIWYDGKKKSLEEIVEILDTSMGNFLKSDSYILLFVPVLNVIHFIGIILHSIVICICVILGFIFMHTISKFWDKIWDKIKHVKL